jgi:diaminopimelate decarboxylase
MPPLVNGDLLAILSAGAYSAAMASSYNTRALPAEVLVEGDQFAVIKPRRSLDDLFADESPTPAFVSPGA